MRFVQSGALIAAVSLLVAVGVAQAQDEIDADTDSLSEVEEQAISGYDEYIDNCAVCHGVEGLGNGPMADAMVVPPANLQLLARNNGGVFPFRRVIDVIENGGDTSSHGSPVMPAWGEAFREEVDEITARAMILELMLHIDSIQAE